MAAVLAPRFRRLADSLQGAIIVSRSRRRLGVILGLAGVLLVTPDAVATFPGQNGRIAFVSAEQEGCGDCGPDSEALWLVRPGARKRLISDEMPAGPRFSPNGHDLTFARSGAQGYDIWLARPPGRARRLAAGDLPTWSPDGTRLAFQTARAGLALIHPDGTGRRVLVASAYPESIAWSPQADSLAFSNGTDVFIVGADGTGLRRIADGHSVAWSARGDVSFLSGSNYDRAHLRAIGPDGTERLLARRVNDSWPWTPEPGYSWAPRGGRVVFGRGTAVYVRPATGGPAKRVLRRANWATWSPDGRRLLLLRGSRLMVGPAHGGRARVVARLPDPSFEADSLLLEADWQALP